MGLGWDSEAQTVVVELLAVSETEFDASVVLDDAEDGPDAVRVFLSPGVGARVRRPLQPGHLRGPAAVPAVRRAARSRRDTSACAPTATDEARWRDPTMTPTL